MNNQTHHHFNQMPYELRQYLYAYLDQSNLIRELREHIQVLLNKNEQLRRNNQRLTLQAIQQLADIQNLEHILANNLDEETRAVQRELDFEDLTDSDTDYSSADEVDV